MAEVMPRCETCRYWERQVPAGWGDCRLPKLTPAAEIGTRGIGDIVTKQSFGCVQHAPLGEYGGSK